MIAPVFDGRLLNDNGLARLRAAGVDWQATVPAVTPQGLPTGSFVQACALAKRIPLPMRVSDDFGRFTVEMERWLEA